MADKRIHSRPEDSMENQLGSSPENLVTQEISSNFDRRAFLMRSAAMNKFTFVVLLVLVGSGLSLYAQRKIIVPPGTKPGGNYSQGILIGDTLFISGQGGEDAAGKIPADFGAEVKQSLDNIDAVLKAAGMSQANVVSVQVYITDRSKFQQMNAVYTTYFKDPRPTRTTVVVAGLVGPGNIEITATAKK